VPLKPDTVEPDGPRLGIVPAPGGSSEPVGQEPAASPGVEVEAEASAGEDLEPSAERVNILIVDDHPETLLAMESLLADLGQNLVTADSGRSALRHLLRLDFALILLDVQMSDLDGFETATMIRARERSRTTPIIFLTAGHRSELQVIRGYSVGAVDYMFKPVMPEILRSKVRVFVELAVARRKLERSARHNATRAATSEEKYRNLMQHASDAVLVLDSEGRVIEVNQRAEWLLGRPRPQVVGTEIATLLNEGGDAARARAVRRLMRESGHVEELSVVDPEGRNRWLEVSTSNVRLGDERMILAICRDVTERRRAEDEIRSLNGDLERRVQERTVALEISNRELEAFSYSVAHDLRAPLRSIMGFSQILAQELGPTLEEDTRRHLGLIDQATHRMAQLISDLLDLSRVTREEMRRAPVDLSALALEIAQELRVESGRDVKFRVQEGLVVQGDERLLRMVLGNLLSNAWKFTSRCPEATVEFGMNRGGSEDVFFVKDNGVGFDMRYVEKLFGVFQRLHLSEFEGTGIGLAIVQRIVQRHGGRVWAEGETDRGATFSFTL
jgi:PAS domain S-box-containing protein